MMFGKRLAGILVSLSALVVMPSSAQAKEKMLIGTLKKVHDTGVLVVGYRESSVPFSFLNHEDKPVGYAIEICNHVIEAVRTRIKMPSMQVLMQPVTSANRLEYLDNGLIDLECGSTTNSVERQKLVDFTNTTFVSNVKILVRKGSGIASFKDLKGKTVVTTLGATADVVINTKAKGMKLKTIYGTDHKDSFGKLLNGEAEAIVLDDVLIAGLVAESNNQANFEFLPDVLRAEPYGFMVRKYDQPFKELVDDTLAGLMTTGVIRQIYAKWFEKPIPPRGINLNFPLSKDLELAFKRPNAEGVK